MTKRKVEFYCRFNGEDIDAHVSYNHETDSYFVHVPAEILHQTGVLSVTITEATTQATTNNFWADNSLNKAYTDKLQSKLTSATQQASNSQSQKKMTRLTTSGDWTIALNESNKLVAFDSNGTTITAVGSLLSADGKAWMWIGSKLWSGVLEQTLTEKQEEAQRIKEAEDRVYGKYRKKMDKLDRKRLELEQQRHAELAEIQNG